MANSPVYEPSRCLSSHLCQLCRLTNSLGFQQINLEGFFCLSCGDFKMEVFHPSVSKQLVFWSTVAPLCIVINILRYNK